ncbi:MAG: tetratricopeptide repeat protein [Phycisphaerales bacterium]|nr:tetratricopeptide repeat protein [Phycisphaerales bacterium]
MKATPQVAMTSFVTIFRPIIVLWLASLLLCGPAQAQSTESHISDPEGALKTRQRLANILVRYANEVMVSVDLNVGGMNVALSLYLEATRLDPDHPDTWRKLLEMSLAMDREDLLEEITRNLLRISPSDKKAQLERLLSAILTYNTADDRIAALDQLLEPKTAETLGPEVSARLAFMMADLHRRRGDIQLFGQWLRESIALDPTYSDAVGIATGFLRDRVADHVAYVELLLGLLTADLTDDNILATLNAYLMAEGAYESAERMITMRMDQLEARGTPAGNKIYQDLAMAQWGQGNHEKALETIGSRREMLNNVYEALAQSEDPSKSPLELAQLKAPLPPQMAAVQVMLSQGLDSTVQSEAMEDLILSVDFEGGLSDMAVEESQAQAARLLNSYWMLLWLNADMNILETKLETIESLSGLSEQAKERIRGWKLLRAGDYAAAAEIFKQDKAPHVMTQIGLAEAYIGLGQNQDAAMALLPIWESQRNMPTGLWARDRLEDLLGVPVPLSAEAMQMNELVAELPTLLDRVPNDPRLAISMRLRPTEDSFKPYDPILIEVKISNNTPLPLAIDQDGPIQDLLLLQGDVRVPYAEASQGPGILMQIPSRFRILPFESLIFTIDLRRYWIGTVVDRHPLYGASVDITAILNFMMLTGSSTGKPSHQPGLMGIETDVNDIRIDGQRVTEAWANRVIDELTGEKVSEEELVDMALMTHIISSNKGSLIADPLPDDVINAGVDTIIDTYPRLDQISRAWLIAVMARSPRLEPIWEMAERSDSLAVHLIQLMRSLDAARQAGSVESLLEESAVITSLNSDIPEVRYLAEWMEDLAQRARDERLEALTGSGEPGG